MTTKICTDLSQSKKLAEFLPHESADMHYNNVSIKGINYVDEHRAELMEYNRAIKVLSKYTINPLFEVIPCWSLSALLDILKYPLLTQDVENKWSITDWTGAYPKSEYGFDCPIDACYKMILKLHEQKLLQL